MTRAEKDRQKRLAQNRRNSKAYRKRLKERAAAVEKAKPRVPWRRSFDPVPGTAATPAAQEPRTPLTPEQQARVEGREPAPSQASKPVLPPPPKPSKEDLSLATDRVRQERAAVKRALAADDALLKRLFKAEDKVEAEHDRGPISEGDGTPEVMVESDCRICGAKKSGTFKSNYCCSACIGSMSFPYHDGSFDDREPNIKAAIARLARRAATHLKLRCAECRRKNVPDPEGTGRKDLVCDDCYRRLDGDRGLERSIRRMKV